jgi:hypothetical protein
MALNYILCAASKQANISSFGTQAYLIYMDGINPRTRLKRYIWIGASIIVFLILLSLAIKFAGSIWLNGHRSQLEQALSSATGLKTRIKGTVTATLFPTPGVSLGGIVMERNGATVAAATNFSVNFDVLPLLNNKLILHEIEINQLWLQLQSDKRGRPMIAPWPSGASAKNAISPIGLELHIPDKIEILNSTIIVRSPANEELHFIKGLNLVTYPVRNRFTLASTSIQDLKDHWQLQLYMNFEQAKFNRLVVGPARLTSRFGPQKGSAELNDAKVFDGNANGTLNWKLVKDKPEYQANLTLTNFDAGKSVLLFRPRSFIQGHLNLSANLSSKGSTLDQVLAGASGTVKMEGTDLDLVSTNLDELVTRIISAKQYNLVDAMAYFFIGPLAASATKGLEIANVVRELSKPGTKPSKIKRIHTSWRLSNGIASAEDVALQTQRYLLALKGRVNLVKKTFEGVEIGVINRRGCAVVTQKISGPVSSPSLGKTNYLLTLTRPMLDALTKSAKGLLDSNCETPFYKGVLVSDTTKPAPVSTQKPTGDAETKAPGQ